MSFELTIGVSSIDIDIICLCVVLVKKKAPVFARAREGRIRPPPSGDRGF
jgi:hypothetical protein